MANNDWSNLGNDIKDIVQQAIDSNDFHKLNQTINDTIHNVTDGFLGSGPRSGWDPGSFRQPHGRSDRFNPGGFPYGDKDFHDGQEQDPLGSSGTSGKGTYTGSPYSGDAYRGSSSKRKSYSYSYNYGKNTASANGTSGTAVSRPKPLTANTGVTRALGLTLAITGYTLSGGFGIATIVLIPLIVLGIVPFRLLALPIIFGLLTGGGIAMGVIGSKISNRAKRFKKYLERLGSKTYCNLKDLEDVTHKSHKYVLKDIKDMIRRGWFLEGHIDDAGTCLITSHETYDEYTKLQQHMKDQETEQSRQAQAQKTESGTYSPEIQEVIDEGNHFLQEIRTCNDAIPGVEISRKISRMELITDKIFQRVKMHPEIIPDLRKFMDYYLPTTVKLLHAYEELDAQPIQGENILSSKKEIEDTLDTLNVAFEKLLDSLFKDTAWDVASDISVLQTMLAQEGLTKDDFPNMSR